MARKKKKVREQRVAAVNAGQLLGRDLSRTGLWIGIGAVVVVILAVSKQMWF